MGYCGCEGLDAMRTRAQFVETNRAGCASPRARRSDRKEREVPGRVMHDKFLFWTSARQVSQLIARRVRSRRLLRSCILRRGEEFIAASPARSHPLRRPRSVYENATPKAPDALFKLRVPVLGICTACRPWRLSSAAKSRIPGA